MLTASNRVLDTINYRMRLAKLRRLELANNKKFIVLEERRLRLRESIKDFKRGSE